MTVINLNDLIINLEVLSVNKLFELSTSLNEELKKRFEEKPNTVSNRKLIIEAAEVELKKLLETERSKVPMNNTAYSVTYRPNDHDSVEFVTNKEKKTVVALIKYKNKELWAKGKSKCAPDDTFNETVGKLIALSRALNVPVDSKFFNIPNLTLKSGTKVKVDFCNNIYTIKDIKYGAEKPAWNTYEGGWLFESWITKILED